MTDLVPPVQRRSTWLALAFLLCLAFALYWPGLHGGFIFDDLGNLISSSTWRLASFDLASLQRAMFSNGSGALGRSLAMLSFGLNYYFSGLQPYAYKLTNVVLHVANGVLLYVLVNRLFRLTQDSTRGSARAALGSYAALVVTALWLLHPLQVSTVLYVIQRMEIGACTGTLIALIGYLRAREAQIAGTPSARWWMLAAAGAALGIGFKETAILIPGFTLVLELSVLHFASRGATRSRTLLGLYGAGVVVALVVFMGWILPHNLQADVYANRDFSAGERVLTQLRVLPMYLGWYVLPRPQSYVFYYDNFPVSTGLLAPATTLAGLCLLIALAVAAFALRKRWPLFALGTGWFFIAHILTSNVIPLELVFEHRNYFSLAAVLIGVSQPIAECVRSMRGDLRMLLALAGIACVAFLCSIQIRVWSNAVNQAVFFSAHNPTSERAAYELALVYTGLANNDETSPYWREAEQQFVRTAQLPGATVLGLSGLIMLHKDHGEQITPQTWQRFRQELTERRIGAQEVSALHRIVDCRVKLECNLDDNEILTTLLAVVGRNPESTEALAIYSNFALGVMHDADLAIRLSERAVELAPGSLQQEANLGVAYALAGRDEKARKLLAHLQLADTRGRYRQTWSKIDEILSRRGQ